MSLYRLPLWTLAGIGGLCLVVGVQLLLSVRQQSETLDKPRRRHSALGYVSPVTHEGAAARKALPARSHCTAGLWMLPDPWTAHT
jgi:hypothetical protein